MAIPPLWSVLAWLALTLVAGVVAVLSLRGRSIATGPTCRRCGYDLSGRPAESARCSECGADLQHPRAVRHHRRQPRLWLAVPAATILAVASLASARAVTSFPWDAWLLRTSSVDRLLYHGQRAPGKAGDRYRDELLRRRDAYALSTAEVGRFYDHPIGLHAASVEPRGIDKWDNLLAWAAEQGDAALDRPRKERLFRQMFPVPVIRVRTPVRLGDPLPMYVDAPKRWGNWVWPRDVEWWIAARLDAEPPPDEATPLPPLMEWSIPPEVWGGDGLPPGRHVLHVRTTRRLVEGSQQPAPFGQRVEDGHRIEIDVLPRGSALGEPVDDPALGRPVADATQIGVYRWDDGRIFATARLLQAPADRSFEILVRAGGVERRIGLVKAPAKIRSDTWQPLLVSGPDPGLEKLTIVLQSSPDALIPTIDQHRYWLGRVVFADVPVQPKARFDSLVNGPGVPTNTPYTLQPER